jgi:hypothetical protein
MIFKNVYHKKKRLIGCKYVNFMNLFFWGLIEGAILALPERTEIGCVSCVFTVSDEIFSFSFWC